MASVGAPATDILHALKNDLLVVQQAIRLAQRECSAEALRDAERRAACAVENLWKLIEALWPDSTPRHP